MRVDFRISPNGRYAACLASDGTPGLDLETWRWARGDGWQPMRRIPARHPQMLVADDGSLLVHDRDGHGPAIWRYDPDGGRRRLTPLGWSADARLLAGPAGDRPGLAITRDSGHCEVWALADGSPGLTRRLARVPGVLMSGLPIDPTGRLLAIERALVPGGPTDVLGVDLATGDWTTLLDTGPDSHDGVLLTHPPSGLLLVGTDAAGARQVGWTRLGRPGQVRFPAHLNPGDEGVQPLAASPDGDRVLLARTVGARTALGLYAPDCDRFTPLDLPLAYLPGPARWTRTALTFAYSTPDAPTRLVTAPPPAKGGPALVGRAVSERAGLRPVPGAAGPIEALVYGGPSWMDSPLLVLALHGGPLSAWRYEHQPLLSRLAAAEAAVVAPNQRGSTGYGVAHTMAIRGAWGGPDLDDILHLAGAIHRHRAARGLGRLRLLGDSYGAYLALLAAAYAPEVFARCAAIAPFLSGRRLHEEAGPGVRGLIDRLGGRVDLSDERGPRDVLRLAGAIRADLFLAHGTRDPMVPVSQSRALRRALLSAGRRDGHDLHYLEVPDGTHELTTDPAGPVSVAVLAFLTATPTFPDGSRPLGEPGPDLPALALPISQRG